MQARRNLCPPGMHGSDAYGDGSGPCGRQLHAGIRQDAYADSEGMDVYWDEDVCQYVAEKTEDGVFYQIWLEDSRSIEAKTAFIRSSGIAGVAGWCLGNETPDVWPVIAAALGDA